MFANYLQHPPTGTPCPGSRHGGWGGLLLAERGGPLGRAGRLRLRPARIRPQLEAAVRQEVRGGREAVRRRHRGVEEEGTDAHVYREIHLVR